MPRLPVGTARDLVDEVVERVVRPTVAELARGGSEFSGLLYCGLALTSRGVKVVEFNCRFGDPETQAVLALLETPLGRTAVRDRYRRHSPRPAGASLAAGLGGLPWSWRRARAVRGDPRVEATAISGVDDWSRCRRAARRYGVGAESRLVTRRRSWC